MVYSSRVCVYVLQRMLVYFPRSDIPMAVQAQELIVTIFGKFNVFPDLYRTALTLYLNLL